MSTPRKRLAVLVFVEVDPSASTDEQADQLKRDVEGMLAEVAGVPAVEVTVEPDPAGPASTLHTPDLVSKPDPVISKAIDGLGGKLLERARHYSRLTVEAGRVAREAVSDGAEFGADLVDAVGADGLMLLRDAVGDLGGLWKKYGLTKPEVVKEAIKYMIKVEVFDTVAEIVRGVLR